MNVDRFKSPAWVKASPRRVMVGLHVPDYDQAPEYAALVQARRARPILADFNARVWVRELKKANVQAFYFYNKCHRGNAYYPSQAPGAHVHSAVKEKGDIFGQLCEACLVEGIVPLAVYEFSDLRVPHDHPDWCHRTYLTAAERENFKHDKKVKPLVDFTDGEQGSRVSGACLNGPYGEYALEQACETVKNYPVEGYYVDFLGLFTFGKWVCPYCAPRFKKDLGFEFEGVEKMSRHQRHDYIRWHYAQNAAYIERMRRAIAAIRPGLVFVHNFHGGYAQTGLQTWEMAHQQTSFITGDLFTMRAGQLQIDWKLRGYAAASRMKPAEALLDSMVAVGKEYHTPKALDSYRAELWTARALNVACMSSFMPDISGRHDRHGFALIKKVFDEQADYEPWLHDMRPEYNIGIMRSGQTLEFTHDDDGTRATGIGESSGGCRHESEFQGWCQALIQGHYLWDVVHDHLVRADYLTRFKVLILPHVVCLSNAQCRAIKAFVRAGGHLIATGKTSLCNENGDARSEFALASTLGIKRCGAWNAAFDRMRITDRALLPREQWVTPVLTYTMGQTAVKPARAARMLGEICSASSVPMVTTLAGTGMPGLLSYKLGRGKTVYFAGLPGMQYRTFGVDTMRRIMCDVVGRMLGKSASVVLAAPGCVALYAHRQPGKSHLVVNLVNWIQGCSRSAGSVNSASMGDDRSKHLRFDEVSRMPPASEVTLRFRTVGGRSVRRVYRVPDRKRLSVRQQGREAVVRVPSFSVHTMLVGEY